MGASGDWISSRPNPNPMTRPGIRRSNGTRFSNLNANSGLSIGFARRNSGAITLS